MMRRILQSLACAFVALFLFCGVSWAAWQFLFPVTIADTSNVTRTYYPVMMGFGGQVLIDAGKISSNGTNTNMQIGSTDIKYMMATGNVTAVVPVLPAGGLATLGLYTGYAPAQSTFAIVTGSGGYVTVSDSASLEIGDNGTIGWYGYVDTSSGGNKNLVHKENAFTSNISADGRVALAIMNDVAPTVVTTNTSERNANLTNHTVDLPLGISAGDLIIVLFTSDGNPTITFPNEDVDWIQLYETSNGASCTSGVWYRIADGGEGATITVTTSVAEQTSDASYRITGYVGVPEAGTPATGDSANPDPPSLAPSWGYATTLWLAVEGNEADTTTSYPTNYTDGFGIENNIDGASSYTARRALSASDEDPGTFTLNKGEAWVANTIAIRPVTIEAVTVTVSSVSSGEYAVEASANTTHLTLTLGATSNSTALGGVTVPDNTNNWLFGRNDVMPYADNITMSVNGTQRLWLAPTGMLSGTNVPDRSGNSNNGMITWGSNANLSIAYGEMSSSDSYSATTNATGGFDVPTALLPSTWFAAGEGASNLPFYDSFSEVAAQTGQPVQMLYGLAIVGVAFGVFIGLAVFTRSALMAYIAMLIVFIIGSSMTIIPWWIIFAMLVVGIGIMYLYRQTAY